ncbi:hypothetical protein LSAT2_003995, partial [Lamellibrachia satsuma]
HLSVSRVHNMRRSRGLLATQPATEQRDALIEDLEKTVSTLETKLDGLEQYSRRANLRFQGLKETAGGEDVEGMIIDTINNDMSVTPPLQ